ncbi:MAG: 1,4-dihydroxy-2-naphthoate polyprenyltransferase [Myxococcales bacterium]
MSEAPLAASPPARVPARVWLLAARPRTLTAAVAPVAVGSAAAAAAGSFRPCLALGALLSATLIQVGTNLANDYSDFKRGADAERVGPVRVTQGGLVAPARVKRAAVACFAGALVVGIALSAAGGPVIVAIGVLSIVAGYAYTGGPWPFGYHGLGDVFVLVFFGLVAVTGTAYLQAGTVPAAAWIAWVPVGCLCTNILVVNNLRDRNTDAKVGKRTPAVRIGVAGTRAEYVVLLVVSFATPALLWALGFAGPRVLLAWLSLPAAVAPLRLVLRGEGAALNPALGGSARLQLLFCLLLAAGMW